MDTHNAREEEAADETFMRTIVFPEEAALPISGAG